MDRERDGGKEATAAADLSHPTDSSSMCGAQKWAGPPFCRRTCWHQPGSRDVIPWQAVLIPQQGLF